MTDTLILYLPEEHSLTYEWAFYNRLGEPAIFSNEMSSPTLPTLVRNHHTHIIVIVPGIQVTLIEAVLPALNPQKLLQAAPNALEEQVAEDLQQLHFAIGQRAGKSGETPIAIVKQDLMRDWLAWLRAQNIMPDQLIPCTLALPYAENSWTLWLEKNTATLRMGKYSGFAVDIQNLAALFTHALTLTTQKPTIIICYHFPEHMLTLNEYIPENITIHYEPITRPRLAYLLPSISDKMSINLLNGKWNTTRSYAKLKKTWLLPGSVAACWLLLNIVYQTVIFFYLNHEETLLQNNIASYYFSVYPNATEIMSPELRLKQTLQTLKHDAVGNGLLTSLTMLAKQLQNMKEKNIDALYFKQGKLTLSINNKDKTSIQSLKNFAAKKITPVFANNNNDHHTDFQLTDLSA